MNIAQSRRRKGPQREDNAVDHRLGLAFQNDAFALLENFPSQRYRQGLSRLHQTWAQDNSTLRSGPPKIFQTKVLCIRLMELLGPYVAASDQVERCLQTLMTVLAPALAQAASSPVPLHVEDVVDFLLLDKESMPAAETVQSYVGQPRMHHKFVANPAGAKGGDKAPSEFDLKPQLYCQQCQGLSHKAPLKQDELPPLDLMGPPAIEMGEGDLPNAPLIRDQLRGSKSQSTADKASASDFSQPVISYLDSRILISKRFGSVGGQQVGGSGHGGSLVLLSRNTSIVERGALGRGSSNFGKRSTAHPSTIVKTPVAARDEEGPASIVVRDDVALQTAEEDNDGQQHQDYPSQSHAHQRAETESQRVIISQYMENLLSQQRHEVNKQVMRTLQTLG